MDESAKPGKPGAERDEEEISLVDLLAVLLRRRRIVIGFTAASLALAVGFFFAAPALGLRPAQRYTVAAKLYPNQVPGSIRGDIGIEVPGYAAALAADPAFIAPAVWDSGLYRGTKAKGPGDPQFLLFLESEFIDQDYKVENAKGILSLSLSDEDQELAERFMRRLAAELDAKLRGIVAERSAELFEVTQDLVGEVGDDSQYLSDYLRSQLVSSKAYSSGDIPLLSELSELRVIAERRGRAKGAGILVVAGFCLGILAAFCAEALESVKRDPESMAKIRSALAAGASRRGGAPKA